MSQTPPSPRRKGGIPRGLSDRGPVFLSYGFRPFFLGAALWALIAVALWLAALSGLLPDLAGGYGPASWHAHEMLFGFAPAVLTGYLLTSVPNWSGRLPVSGLPLALLFALWCAGRLALPLLPQAAMPAVAVDAAFLPAVALLCGREIVSGRKWADLKLVAVLVTLAAANGGYHAAVLAGSGADRFERLATALYIVLIALVGGKMIPSFTRGQLRAQGVAAMPAPYGALDRAAVALSLPALSGWVLMPDHRLTALMAAAAAAVHGTRLLRWRGWQAREPLVLAMHAAYGFIPLGLAAITLGAAGRVPTLAALHLLAVGAMGGMMLAVMMRATRGHAGKATTGSTTSGCALAAILLSAVLRFLAGLLPEQAGLLHMLAGGGWIAAFGLFVVEYGPILLFVRRAPREVQESPPTRISMR